MPTPMRDYKRHRRKRSKPRATGRRFEHWIQVDLGIGDPLPSAVERVIRRSGAAIAGSGSTWAGCTWTGYGMRWPWGPPRGPRPRQWRALDYRISSKFRHWWRICATGPQIKSILRELRRIGAVR